MAPVFALRSDVFDVAIEDIAIEDARLKTIWGMESRAVVWRGGDLR